MSWPGSLRDAFEQEVEARLGETKAPAPLTDEDLAALPPPVVGYLRATGAVGAPRVHNFYARMHGRIRSGPRSRWIQIEAEQFSFLDDPARLFYLKGSMFGLPVRGYHRYVGSSATMTINAAGLVPIVRASGAEMDRGETVTMFNDMCVMAPATLVSRAIEWQPVDDQAARARFTNAGHTVRAELSFDDAGRLTNFWSDDRYQIGHDGVARRLHWSTPITGYRPFGSFLLPAGGEARWLDPAAGEYAYIELTFDAIRYNVAERVR